MLKTARVPERLYEVVMWLVSLIFAGFLVGLGNLVIGDLPQIETTITQEQFLDQRGIAALRAERTTIERRQGAIADKLDVARLQLEQAQAASSTTRESFEAWIKTRIATTDPAQDPEVLTRTRQLEALKGNERRLQERVAALENEQLPSNQRLAALSDQEMRLNDAAAPAYEKALFWQELKVFLYRLLITLPMLAIGAWLIAKKRKSDYWPLARGFVIASLFVFFVELVPYLPSYGGYIRYIVGIVLTLIAGYYLIRNMRAYLERLRQREQQNEEERRARVSRDEAFKKMAANICPDCDRPVATTGDAQTNYCVHCGLTLYDKCGVCETRKMAFFRHCMVCGTPATEATAEPA